MGIRLQAGKQGNFHTNFVDLNPGFTHKKHDRAVKMANKVVGRVGSSLHAAFKKRHLNIYKGKFESGERLSYSQIRELKADYRDVYKKVIVQEQDNVTKEVKKVVANAQDASAEAYDLIADIQDQRDEANDAEEKATQEMKKSYLARKGSCDEVVLTVVKEFNLSDANNTRARGRKVVDNCWACKRGVNCPKHGL